jgi:hypothetical protein
MTTISWLALYPPRQQKKVQEGFEQMLSQNDLNLMQIPLLEIYFFYWKSTFSLNIWKNSEVLAKNGT